MSEIVRWLLVGAGDIAQKRVAPALAQTPNSRLVAVCDPARDRAESLARTHGAAAVYADFEEALERTDATAVYLATPVALHAGQAERVLASGRHVLVEKPLGVTAVDAARAVAAAGGRGLRAGCAYFRRCSPRYAHARQMLASGEFGTIVLVRLAYASWYNPETGDPKYWRVVPGKSGGGPLSDVGTHMFDVMIGLLGMPRSVYAKVSTKVQPYQVEDSSAMLMELENGADVVATCHWNSKTWVHTFEIVGTEARLLWQPYDGGKVLKTVGRETQELDLPNPANVHQPLIEDFVAAIREGRDPAVPLSEALKTNRLLDAVYRSARERQEIRLKAE